MPATSAPADPERYDGAERPCAGYPAVVDQEDAIAGKLIHSRRHECASGRLEVVCRLGT